jgi:hypothetical protein
LGNVTGSIGWAAEGATNLSSGATELLRFSFSGAAMDLVWAKVEDRTEYEHAPPAAAALPGAGELAAAAVVLAAFLVFPLT